MYDQDRWDITASPRRRLPPPPPPKTVNLGKFVPVVVVLLVGYMLVRSASAAAPPNRQALAAIDPFVGVWTSSDPAFAGRSVTVSRERIELGRGPDDGPGGGAIRSIETWTEMESRVVLVTYQTPEGLEDLEMYLEPSGVMRMRNPYYIPWARR